MKQFAILLACLLLAPVLMVDTAQAAASTSQGTISVAQVNELVAKADGDAKARQTLIAYLAGVGETAGFLVAEAKARNALNCAANLSMDTGSVSKALAAAAPSRSAWQETPATPIILNDMLNRASCK